MTPGQLLGAVEDCSHYDLLASNQSLQRWCRDGQFTSSNLDIAGLLGSSPGLVPRRIHLHNDLAVVSFVGAGKGGDHRFVELRAFVIGGSVGRRWLAVLADS